jgi:hypothetical protein
LQLRILEKAALTVFLSIASCLLPLEAARAQSAPHFSSEQEAVQHCPKDTVVWVNTKTGVYHFKGQRWYGNTREGAFECRRDADVEGDRATRNGQ